MMINNLTIIGTGLIGGSLALACKKHGLVGKVIGLSRSQGTLDQALKLGIIDEGFCDAKSAVENADIVIICTPLSSYKEIAQQISPYLRDDVIISDVGSVKQRPSQDILSGLDDKFHANFIPAHPIAGTEKSGPEAAFDSLYDGKNILITPLQENNQKSVQVIVDLWHNIGAYTEIINAHEHDKIYAIVSHIVQFLSYSYGASAACLEEKIQRNLVAKQDINFQQFIRLCGSDSKMWQDIFQVNKIYLLQSIESFEQHLDSFCQQIAKNEQGKIYQRLNSSKQKRMHFHELLKSEQIPEQISSNIDNIDGKTLIWLDILPRIIATILMEIISENEYQHATGAGLYGLSKNIILPNATNTENIFANKKLLLNGITELQKNISSIKNNINNDSQSALQQAFGQSLDFYKSCYRSKF